MDSLGDEISDRIAMTEGFPLALPDSCPISPDFCKIRAVPANHE